MSEEATMERTSEGNGHTAIWARLASVETEYKRLGAERDEALLERDKARAALVPLLEQVEKLRDTILAQLPKKDARLPSQRGYVVTPEMVDKWLDQWNSGMSLMRIAQDSGTRSGTVGVHLRKRGINTSDKRPFQHKKAVCQKCGEALPAGEEGVCESCLEVDRVVEEHRMRKEEHSDSAT